MFFPMKGIIYTPEVVGLPYEEIYFETSDNKRLNGWFIPAEGAKFTFIFCHGNAGNIGHRLEKLSIFFNLGLNVFIFDYRGYGKSAGSPSEQGFYEDALAAYNYLTAKRKIPKDSIILYGESIGGAVAIDLASKVKPKGVITEETFTSTADMAKMAYFFIPHQIFSSRFNSVSKISDVGCPKLVIHSADDEIVPFDYGEKLFDAARPPKKFLKIRGTHNTAFLESRRQFTDGIRGFLSDLL